MPVRVSILGNDPAAAAPPPAYARDLNLDQVVDALQASRPEHPIAGFYWSLLPDADAVRYRQEVFADLEDADVRAAADRFTEAMGTMRRRLDAGHASHIPWQARRWQLDAVVGYCRAVQRLATDLDAGPVRSRGLLGIRAHVTSSVSAGALPALRDGAVALLADLDAVRYAVLIRGTRLTIGPYDDEDDYSAQVADTFARFRQGEVADHHSTGDAGPMNRVEAGVLDQVARLHPELFGRLAAFCATNADFVDDTLRRFDLELQFYLAYLDLLAPLRRAGLATCLPAVSAESKDTRAEGTYDLALAATLVRTRVPVVVNDLRLTGAERVLVVSGPNQGGKTTLARTFGQLHHLAGLGCPVPGTGVRLFLADAVFTHFEREEDLDTLAGKLEDDLVRIHAILAEATGRSVIVLNEIFASTTVQDAAWLGTDILRRIVELDALCLCVTFLDELSRLGPATVSVVSTVDPVDPARRTYRLVRRRADGRAYARAVAEKYGLTYETLKGRVGR